MRTLRGVLLALTVAALVLLPATASEAQERPGGPTPGDFTDPDGTFDTEGYLAAFVEFQTAPDVARAAFVSLDITGCPPLTDVQAVLLGAPETTVTGVTDSEGEALLSVFVPASTELGFNRIRVTCGSLVRDIVINVIEAGGATGVAVLGVSLSSPSPTGVAGEAVQAPRAPLPRTGSDVRDVVAGGIAVALVGAALVLGVRHRLVADRS